MCARVARNWLQLNKPLASWKRVPLCGGRSRAKPGRCSIIHSTPFVKVLTRQSFNSHPFVYLRPPQPLHAVNTIDQAEVIMTCLGVSWEDFLLPIDSGHSVLCCSESIRTYSELLFWFGQRVLPFGTLPNQNLSIRHKYNRGKTASCLLNVALLLYFLGRVCSAMWHVILYWTTILSSFTSECSSSV
jgi:hypothetical protein